MPWGQVQWCTPVIPAVQKVKRRSEAEGQPWPLEAVLLKIKC